LKRRHALANLGSANLLHMLRRDNFMSRDRARAAGHHQHKLGPNPFQLGGSFIFAAGNIGRFAHASAKLLATTLVPLRSLPLSIRLNTKPKPVL
jgi:hypothetical protein